MRMTPRDLEHEWEAYDVLVKVNRHVCQGGRCVSDSIPSQILRFLHIALGWDFFLKTHGDGLRHTSEHTLYATCRGGLIGFLADDSYQSTSTAETPEKAVRSLEDLLKKGCTAYAAFNSTGKAKWVIPSFSNIEELRMKANICGGIDQWSRQCR